MASKQPTPTQQTILSSYANLAVALAAYSALSYYFRFTQDDAFITYRYIANFLDGHGLVYNFGERICGYTNFGWTILLVLIGSLKIDYITASRVIGFLCGVGIILLTFRLGRQGQKSLGALSTASAALIVGANLSLAYWAPAGLETAAFSLAVLFSLYWYLNSNRLLPFGLALAVLLRPEGAVVCALLIVIETVTQRRLPRYSLRSVAIAFVICLPYVLFMYFYYGSILPNPFYAKTAFGWEQFSAGLNYTWLFMKHFGLLGLPVIVNLLFWKRISLPERQLVLFVIGYILYIIFIGGDVLKVHRFFVPLSAPYALITVSAIINLTSAIDSRIRTISRIVLITAVLCCQLLIPWKYTVGYNSAEKGLVSGMTVLAKHIAEADNRNFTIAATTIGALGYELRIHTVIDMLGLTDSTIARHPQPPVKGIQTSWRERKYNTSYVLGRNPDYIIFSTGMKASAPAEKVLLLQPEFLRCYRTVTFPQPRNAATGSVMLDIAYRRVRSVNLEDSVLLPAEFAEYLTRAQQFYSDAAYDSAFVWLQRARLAGDTVRPYPELLYLIAGCKVAAGDNATGYDMLNQIVAEDSAMYNAHLALYMTEAIRGNREKAAIHRAAVAAFSPAQVPLLDSSVANYLSSTRRP